MGSGKVESGWLLEGKGKDGYPDYFKGSPSCADYTWTRDSLEAIRFSRKEDAEAIKMTFLKDIGCEAVEHQWGW